LCADAKGLVRAVLFGRSAGWADLSARELRSELIIVLHVWLNFGFVWLNFSSSVQLFLASVQFSRFITVFPSVTTRLSSCSNVENKQDRCDHPALSYFNYFASETWSFFFSSLA
jgi:hypothetical protein